MYELSVDSHFDAAHRLEGYDGACARVHGHTWRVTVTVEAHEIDNLGLSLDFKHIAAALDKAVGRFDHRILNDLEEFAGENPTAERISRLLFDRLSGKLNAETVRVDSVTVWEGDRNRVTYRGDRR